MALTRVQATPKGSNGNPAVCSFSSPPTVGNAIVVIAIVYGGSPVWNGVTDNQGNTYSFVTLRENANPKVLIHFCPRITFTGSPFTITGVNAGYLAAIEVGLGAGQMLALDKFVTNIGSSSAPSTGITAAITSADCIGVAGFSIEAAQASITVVGAAPVWTEDFENLVFFGSTGEANDRILTGVSGSTQSCSWTGTAAAGWAAALAVFKAETVAAAAGGGEFSAAYVG